MGRRKTGRKHAHSYFQLLLLHQKCWWGEMLLRPLALLGTKDASRGSGNARAFCSRGRIETAASHVCGHQ